MDGVEATSSAQLWAEFVGLNAADSDGVDDARAEWLVQTLNRRGELELVQWALPLLASPAPSQRQAAAWVLQQHGVEAGRSFGDVIVPTLVAAAHVEPDVQTLRMLVNAIGYADDPRWVGELTTYATHPDAEVRLAVASHLPLMMSGDDLPDAALDVLTVLTDDTDPHVRDWATFGLAVQTDPDSPGIRAALHARLHDHDGEPDTATSGEALLGLARRHDAGITTLLHDLLDAPIDEVGNLTVEAAGALGDPDLLPLLTALRDAGWADIPAQTRTETLEAAITALTGSPTDPPRPDQTQPSSQPADAPPRDPDRPR